MKRIVSIQDFSCVGKCSLTAAIPVISAAGVEACAIPTALLSNHTGFSSFYSLDLTDRLAPIGEQLKREKITFDAVYTGYIASVPQMKLIERFIDDFRTNDTLIFVDPVMGDNGKIYPALSSDYPENMRTLCGCADIITPNLTEACLLTGRDFCESPSAAQLDKMLAELLELGAGAAVITGVCRGSEIGIVGELLSGERFERFSGREQINVSGTGDVFASALLGAVMRGADVAQAAAIAEKFTSEAVRVTAQAPDRRFYGIHFEQALGYYIRLLEQIEKRDGNA
ncbi:MAG: pyridoxamine kinase [Oscillospiraceae bacterium]